MLSAMAQALGKVVMVAGATVGSRVLGLLRDILFFAALGTSLYSSAFLLAFTLPNLFRRLLGEGALTSALIPVFSRTLEKRGPAEAHALFNQVLTRLLVLLGVISMLGSGVLFALSRTLAGGRWSVGAELAAVLLPYLLLVCVAAILAAALQVLKRFGIAALSQVWLNLCMIGALALGWWQGMEPAKLVWWLVGGVMLGGLVQVLAPMWQLQRQGWQPRLDWQRSEALQRVGVLMLPGLAGAAVMQVNQLVSRLLAYRLDQAAVAELYLANRLVELPLGVFVIAVATVLFPELSQHAARQAWGAMGEAYRRGARLILAITIPAAVGLVTLREPILQVLFVRGEFTRQDAQATALPLAVYALALPMYALATLAVRAFHARENMRTPVWAALINMALNAVLSILLMGSLGTVGLALAGVIAVTAQYLYLAPKLVAERPQMRLLPILGEVGKVILAAGVMCLALFGGQGLLSLLSVDSSMLPWLSVLILIPIGVAVYSFSLHMLKFTEVKELWRILLRR